MDSSSASVADKVFQFAKAWYVGQDVSVRIGCVALAAASASIVLLMAAVVGLHARSLILSRKRERLKQEWFASLLDPAPNPARLRVPSSELHSFARMWAHLLDSVRGEYRDELVSLLSKSSVPELLRRKLRGGAFRDRLLSITMLGDLRDEASRSDLAGIALGRDPYLSLAAASAMISIHPRESVEILLPHMVSRHDWPLSRVHATLAEADQAMVSSEIVGFVMASLPDVPFRAIRLLTLVGQESRSMLLRTIFLFHPGLDPESEAALLDEIQDPLLLDFARERLGHQEWIVVVAALKVIGRAGTAQDLDSVAKLLEHPQWWVRYRAARAMVELPGIKPIQIELVAAGHPDPYARDMLRFALAERNLS